MFRTGRRSILAGLGGLLAAQAAPAIAQPVAPRPQVGPPELRIGAVYPASGPLAMLGDESFRGLELAVDARNAAGGVFGRPLRLIRAEANNPAQTAQATRVLMSIERVAALFGTTASPLAMAATQVAELQGVPFFELGAIADAITAREYQLVFRSAPRGSDYAALSLHACADLLPKLWNVPVGNLKVAVLHENGAYGQSVGIMQETQLRAGPGPRIVGRFGYPVAAWPGQTGNPPPAPDFPALVQRLRNAAPDIVLHTGYETDIVALFRAMREAAWAPRMVIGSGAGYSLLDTARAIGPGFEGVMVVDMPPYAVAGPLAEPARLLAERYMAKFGHDPRSGHSLGNAMGAEFFLEAMHRAGSPDRDRIRAAVLALRQDDQGGWPVSIDETGQNRLALPMLSQWQGQDDAMRPVSIFPTATAIRPPRARMGPSG
jgi:branched-chain amino acid transport system substrate-binding protein